MSYRKRGAGLLCSLLAVAALGTAAFASTAQAVTTEYTINGSLALLATFGAEQNGAITFLVPSLNIEIKCQRSTTEEGHILNGLDAQIKLLFEECTVLEFGGTLQEIPECHIVVNNALVGGDYRLHILLTALLLPIEFASGHYGILFEKINALVLLLKDTGCPLPLDTLIKGEICSLIDNNDTTKPLLLMSQAIQGSCPERVTLEGPQGAGFKDKLLYGLQEAFLDASIHLFLTGPHAGMTLGVLLL